MAVGPGVAEEPADARRRTIRDPAEAARETAAIQSGLARIIESEILPRLARTHPPEGQSRTGPVELPKPERVAALARSLIHRDLADSEIDTLLNEGLPLDALLLDLLAPAARHLGELWEDDEADFVAVTTGLGRLHALACRLCEHLERDGPSNGRRVLLLPCPGETHRFSLALVASFFREAGWIVVLASAHDVGPLALVRAERFDVIGISLSCDVLLPAMAELVADLRVASCNPGVRVLVGGPLFLRDPASAATIGADATAEDGRSAVRVAERLCEEHPDGF